MSEMAEFWKDVNAYGRAKRAANKDQSTATLARACVPFESHNDGVHLVVAGRFDYWPSTGLFIDRSGGARGRGIANLLRRVRSL